ncbi:hypothetical protein BDV18DRAFT_159157 [Aspergillus unguis]
MPRSTTPRGSTRNQALFAILAVIGGSYALFRYQSPREGLVKEDDVANAMGTTKLGRSKVVSKGDVDATMGGPPDARGTEIGRSPRKASSREDF